MLADFEIEIASSDATMGPSCIVGNGCNQIFKNKWIFLVGLSQLTSFKPSAYITHNAT